MLNNQTPVSPDASLQAAREPRRRVLIGAKLILNDGQSVLDCVVRDMSESGAKVKLTLPTTLPKDLDLLIVKDNLRYKAEVRWNRNGEVGLQFTSAGKVNVRSFGLPDRREGARSSRAANSPA